MGKIRVGIIGGAGYTGGEAVRLLINHPEVELVYVHSNSNGGNPVSDVHADLFGDTEMRFVDTPIGELPPVDVMFLCVGHGDARKFLEANHIPADVRIIDLSQDFRIAPETEIDGHSFVYGLPEQKIHHVIFENASFSFAEDPTAGVPAMMDGVDKQTNTGIFAKNIETLELRNVTVSGQNGDAVINDGIDQFVQ